MKKYPIFFLLAIIILIVSVITPNAVYASLPKVKYIKAVKTNAIKTVSVLGKIKSNKENTQTANCVYFVDSVLINTGDYVKKGERILKIDLEKTNLIYAKNNARYSGELYVTSDFEGTVSSVFIADNSIINENATIFNVIDTDDLCASLMLNEDVFSKIKIGQNAKISGSAFKKEFDAKIISIGAVANQVSASPVFVEAIAKIHNPDKSLKHGFNIKAKITTKKLKDVIIIPSHCILQEETLEFVYKLEENKAKKVYVKTSSITAKGTTIKSGITSGDLIITNPDAIEKDETLVSLEE